MKKILYIPSINQSDKLFPGNRTQKTRNELRERLNETIAVFGIVILFGLVFICGMLFMRALLQV